jgi:hypothetical protein
MSMPYPAYKIVFQTVAYIRRPSADVETIRLVVDTRAGRRIRA